MIDRGWICRNVVVWRKRNSMPSSAGDRMKCTWEPVFVFAKKGRYYSDVEAVRQAISGARLERAKYPRKVEGGNKGGHTADSMDSSQADKVGGWNDIPQYVNPSGANPGDYLDGSAWPDDVLELTAQPSKVRHYAMYPVRLPLWFMRWLLPRAVCPECGKAWRREVARTKCDNRNMEAQRQLAEKQYGRGDGYVPGLGGKVDTVTTLSWSPSCECGAPDGFREDDLEIVRTPLGEDGDDDPSLTVGRAGYERPRKDEEGVRPITRYEQRAYAAQLRASERVDEMAAEAGPAFDHYLRTDRSGARPIPPDLLDRWIGRGWLWRVTVPEFSPPDPIGATILDPYAGPGTTCAAAEYLWTHPAEGMDTVLADARMEPTRPGTDSKFREGDGSQRPEYAKARMCKTGTPTTVFRPWLPGRAICIDLDPAVEGLYPQRRDECFASLDATIPGLPTGQPDAPLFEKETK